MFFASPIFTCFFSPTMWVPCQGFFKGCGRFCICLQRGSFSVVRRYRRYRNSLTSRWKGRSQLSSWLKSTKNSTHHSNPVPVLNRETETVDKVSSASNADATYKGIVIKHSVGEWQRDLVRDKANKQEKPAPAGGITQRTCARYQFLLSPRETASPPPRM